MNIASDYKGDWAQVYAGDEYDGAEIVRRIRWSLEARLEGRNEGGDIEVMRLVDEIVKKEGYGLNKNGHALDCWCSKCDLID